MAQNDGAKQTASQALTGEVPVEQREQELRKAQDNLADAKDAAKRDEEMEKAVAQYAAAHKGLAEAQAELEAKRREEIDWLAATDAEKAVIETERDSAKEPIDKATAEVGKAKSELKQAKAKLDTAKLDRDKAQTAFEALKNQAKLVEARHRAAAAIAKDAADARCKGHKLLAYNLLEHDLGKEIGDEPQPIDAASYETAIRAASAALGRLNRTAANLESAIKADEKALAEAEKHLADLNKASETTLRAKLIELS